jgi:hypothetical protein
MNVAQAKASLVNGDAIFSHDVALAAATVLADETIRLEHQLDRTRAEYAAAIERWADMLDDERLP